MFKPVFGNDNYLINLKGELRTAHSEECTLPIADNKVTLTLFRSKRTVDITWLKMMSHYEVSLSGSHFRWAWDITFVDFIPQIFKSVSCSKMILPRPLMIDGRYRLIPGFLHLAISECGEIIERREANWYSVIIQRNGDEYPYVEVYDPDFSKVRRQMVHRLVALAWVTNPFPEQLHLVNHKNGIKTDYRKINLEWIDAAGNSVHAIKYGLRSDAVKCKIFDNFTGLVHEFLSLGAACRHMGTTNRNLSDLIGTKDSRSINGRYQFRVMDDTRPWILGKDLDRGNGRYIVTISAPDGKIETYRDTRLIIKEYKLWNISYNIEIIREAFLNKFPNHIFTWVDQYITGPFQALRISDNRVFEAKTMAKLGEMVGEKRSTIRRKISNNDQKPLNGFSYRVSSQAPWEHHLSPFTESNWCINAIHPIHGVLSFNSLRSTAKHFNVDRSLISARLKNNNTYKGWAFNKVQMKH